MTTHEFTLNIDDEHHKLQIHISISHEFIQEYRKKTLEDPLAQQYNIEEDRALLFFDVSRSRNELDDKKAPSNKDLAKIYRGYSRKNPRFFPKVTLNGGALKEQLLKLQSEGGLRYQILYTDVSEEINRLKKEEEERSIKESENKFGFSYMKRPSVNRIENQVDEEERQNDKMKEPFHREAQLSSIVQLTTTGRNFKPKSFRTREKYLSSASQYFRELLTDVQEEVNSDDGMIVKKIGISEFDKQFKLYDMGETFHPDNIERFIRYCENPDFQEKFLKAKQSLDDLTTENQISLNKAIDSLNQSKSKRLSELMLRIESEKHEFRKILTKCKEFDIERLRIMYEVHLQNEYEKLDRLMEIRSRYIDLFFEREINRTSELFEQQQRLRIIKTEKELKESTLLHNEILPENGLVTMLTLSDVVRSDDLRDTCIKILGQTFSLHYQDKHLGCQLLTLQTLQQLLSQLPTGQLQELAEQYDYYFPRDIVLKEIEYRKGILVAEYKDCSVPELLAKMTAAEGTVFSDLLANEIMNRKKKKPFVSLNPIQMSPFLKLHEDGLTIELRGHKRYSCVHATHSRSFEGWGKWYFEVVIEEFDESYGSSISIGWDVPRDFSCMDGPIIGMTPGEKNLFGCAWQSDGILHYEGCGVYIEEQFKQGDTISCSLDQDKKVLTFFKNGHRITLIKREQHNKKYQEIKTLPITEEFYTLVPAACLYSARKNSKCKVRFNFSGNFNYPVPQWHESYGNERVYARQMKALQLQKDKQSDESSSLSRNNVYSTENF